MIDKIKLIDENLQTLEVYKVNKDFDVEEFNKKATEKTITFSPGDLIYISKYCSLARFKLKGLLEKEQVKITRDPNKAKYIIVNNDVVRSYENEIWACYITKEVADRLCNELPDLVSNSMIRGYHISVIINRLAEAGPEGVLINSSLAGSININIYQNMKSVTQGITDGSTWSKIRVVNEENYPKLNYILNNQDRIVNEEVILNMLNENTTMNEKLYTSVKEYFDSPDESNYPIAMEVMANCNFKESAVYLLLLFNQYGRYKMMNRKEFGHVNFRGLLTYFELDKQVVMRMNYQKVIEILRKKDLDTQENIDIITPFIIAHVSDYDRVLNYFKISGLKYEKQEESEEQIDEIESEQGDYF